jgi:hypothetical protein
MSGDRHLATENEPAGLVINYFLKESLGDNTQVVIHDATGNEVAKIVGNGDAGINQVHWDSSEDADAVTGVYRITVFAGDMESSTFAKLTSPRAFSIGQNGSTEAL